ncbi:MAG: PD-(D/E)XK nuclease family protein [Planctomycetes bacterium]|nr:PD-(D/E)XK nuclease family protein [Planctomycetota bacterium]
MNAGTVVVARGARAAERAALAVAAAARAGPGAELGLLARPFLVVVPSNTLRQHFAVRLCAACGAALGLEVCTLASFAERVLAHAGQPGSRGGELLPVLVRRELRRERELQGLLAGHGGMPAEGIEAAAAASVRDLLDAGAVAVPLHELTAAAGNDPGGRRAAALCAVAQRSTTRAAGLGVRGGGDAARNAARLLREHGAAALPARGVLVHGFADATGHVAALLHACLALPSTTLVLDLPADPDDAAHEDRGARFARRFLARVRGAARVEEQVAPPDVPRLRRLVARGPEDQARRIAAQVRAWIAAGTPPEEIAVVARQLAPHAAALRVAFEALGIPFSGAEPAELHAGAAARRAALRLLREGGSAAPETWSAARGPRACLDAEVLAGARAFGVATLAALAGFDVAAHAPHGSLHVPGRRHAVDAGPLGAAAAEAGALLRGLEALSAARDLGTLRAALGPLAGRLDAVRELADDVLPRIAALDPDLELTADEFVGLLAEAEQGRTGMLGGEGAGVQVLDVTEARGLTCARLVVVGLERDSFPRTVREDPFVPDAVRRRLAGHLPDLAEKEHGHDEERYLFAQLLGAAPDVLLCRQAKDAAGRSLAPSPWIAAPQVAGHDPDPLPAAAPATPLEWLVQAGLGAGRAGFAALVPLALREAEEQLGVESGGGVAAHRLAALAAHDPTREEEAAAEGLGLPATLGRVAAPPEPRSLAVTGLEDYATCPWQHHLERELGLEPVADPLRELPDLDARIVGSAVHLALERLVVAAEPALARDTELGRELLLGEAVSVPAPDADTVAATAAEAAASAARSAGVHLPGLHHALATLVRRHVERAVALAWHAGPRRILAVETGCEWHVPSTGLRLSFRADVVERDADGALVLTDYKTGKPLVTSRKDETRYRDLLRRLREGSLLQGAVYAEAAVALLAGAPEPPSVRGCYLHLRPDLEVAPRVEVPAGDAQVRAALQETLGVLHAARGAGLAFPRLEGPDGKGQEPLACGHCPVALACSRGDSGARRRLAALAELGTDRLLTRLWLPARDADGAGGDGP